MPPVLTHRCAEAFLEQPLEVVGVVEAAVASDLKDCVVGLFKLTAHFGETYIKNVFVDGLSADLAEAGIVDNDTSDVTSDSVMNQTYLVNGQPVKTAPDIWYPDSLNLKEFVRYVGRNKSGTLHRPKTIVWNLPQGAAEKFGMQMSYKCPYYGELPMTNSLVTTVNGTVVHENADVHGNLVSFRIEPETGIFHDGENTIVLDFLTPTRTDGKKDCVTPDMIAIEPLRPKKGTVICFR